MTCSMRRIKHGTKSPPPPPPTFLVFHGFLTSAGDHRDRLGGLLPPSSGEREGGQYAATLTVGVDTNCGGGIGGETDSGRKNFGT